MTDLTTNITLEEMTTSGRHPEVENVPPDALAANILRTAEKVEEAYAILSAAVGRTILPKISYGYRGPALNKAVGSVSKTSAHLEGSAADMLVPDGISPRKFWDILRYHSTFMADVDQLIIERGCVHLGLPVAAHDHKPRHELRTETRGLRGVNYPLFGIWKPAAKQAEAKP